MKCRSELIQIEYFTLCNLENLFSNLSENGFLKFKTSFKISYIPPSLPEKHLKFLLIFALT